MISELQFKILVQHQTGFSGNASIAVKLLDEDKNKRKYYKILLTKVGGNLVNVQMYENTITSGFLFGVYNREGEQNIIAETVVVVIWFYLLITLPKDFITKNDSLIFLQI